MRWLRRKIRRWLDDSIELAVEPAIIRSSTVDIEGLSFNVMPANGGVIVQTRHYDRKTDRNTYNTHIITDQENLAERVGQIVALEILKS
jgi:hypothetical protein